MHSPRIGRIEAVALVIVMAIPSAPNWAKPSTPALGADLGPAIESSSSPPEVLAAVERGAAASYRAAVSDFLLRREIAAALASKGGYESVLRDAKAMEVYRIRAESVVLLMTMDRSSAGSGVIVKEKTFVLTNAHVVADQREMMVVFKVTDLRKVTEADVVRGEVIAIDTTRDLALLRLAKNPRDAAPAPIGKLDSIAVGADVYSIGHPLLLTWTLASGVISAIRPDHELGGGKTQKATVLQSTAPIHWGNSGGPLFNEKGEVIGINTFFQAGQAPVAVGGHEDQIPVGQTFGFAVACNELEDFLAHAREKAPLPAKRASARIVERRDTNGNSVPDCFGVDADGDGSADYWIIDSNEDGKTDGFVLDIDNDGVVDAVGTDTNGDGRPDRWKIDRNKDGVADMVLIDTDGDGLPDKREALKPK